MSPQRNDNVTTSGSQQGSCRRCGKQFRRIRRQLYCEPACRQAAWRARHTEIELATAAPNPPIRHRRNVTVYVCGECEQRYLGEQWCHDCSRPCTRDGLGGLCPCCDEPVTVEDLLDQHQPASIRTSKIR